MRLRSVVSSATHREKAINWGMNRGNESRGPEVLRIKETTLRACLRPHLLEHYAAVGSIHAPSSKSLCLGGRPDEAGAIGDRTEALK